MISIRDCIIALGLWPRPKIYPTDRGGRSVNDNNEAATQNDAVPQNPMQPGCGTRSALPLW